MKKIRILTWIFYTASAWLLISCAPTRVSSNYVKSIDFKVYKSFAWLSKTHQSCDSVLDNQIVETNIKNLVSGEMKSRGLVVDVNEPDLLLDFYIDIADKVDQVTTPVYGYAYNYNNYYNGFNRADYNNRMYYRHNSYYNNNSYLYNNRTQQIIGYNTQDIPYQEGTLTILMIDRKSNRLVWKGWSVGTITDEAAFEYELPSDVRRLFKQFPVPLLPKSKK